jgi:hypothetical protein
MPVPDICGVFMYLWLVNFGPVVLLCQWVQLAYLFYQPVSRLADYYYYYYYAHLLFLGTTFGLTPSYRSGKQVAKAGKFVWCNTGSEGLQYFVLNHYQI